MKKLLAFFMSFFVPVCTISGCLIAFAENIPDSKDKSNDVIDDIRSTESISFSCSFDPSAFSINLSGTVTHDVLIQYRDHTLEIYAIPLGKSVESVVFDYKNSAIAETPIAVRFQFSKKITSVIEKYYSYCVVLKDSDGKRILATDPKYAEVTASFAYYPSQRTAYKGVESELLSSAVSAGAGRVIIPISLNKLISEASSGYIYQTNNENIYFEKSYIEKLDSKVRTATSEDSDVYFRIFAEDNGSGISVLKNNETVLMPNVYDEKTLTRIEGAVSFLADRYENNQSGILNGIIIGKNIDELIGMSMGQNEYDLYIDMYVLYTIVIANSARQICPDIDIVMPFSDANILSDTSASVLELLISRFDQRLGSGLNCSVLLESDTSPLAVDENNKASIVIDDNKINVSELALFDKYLNELSGKFISTPKSFSFCWNVSEDIRSNTLISAYVYSYLKLIECQKLSSFIVSFTDRESCGDYSGFSEIKHIFDHIDTEESERFLGDTLKMFSALSWEEVLERAYLTLPSSKKIISARILESLPEGWIGEFAYFDFSKSVSFRNWFKGENCKDLRLEYGNDGAFFRAGMMPSLNGEYSELLCLYDYYESFKYTPYLAFKFEIDAGISTNTLFEIAISGGEGEQRLYASKTVTAGKEFFIILDISEYTQGIADSLKISIRSLEGTNEDFSLLIYSVIGYSMEYDSQALADKIEQERLLARNQSLVTENSTDRSTLTVIITVAILIIALGIGVFVCIRQSGDSAEKNGEDGKT